MNIARFFEDLTEVLEETDVASLHSDTVFRDIEEWDSLLVLSLIAMLDDKYGVKLSAPELSDAATLQDIYDLLEKKQNHPS